MLIKYTGPGTGETKWYEAIVDVVLSRIVQQAKEKVFFLEMVSTTRKIRTCLSSVAAIVCNKVQAWCRHDRIMVKIQHYSNVRYKLT